MRPGSARRRLRPLRLLGLRTLRARGRPLGAGGHGRAAYQYAMGQFGPLPASGPRSAGGATLG
jgi:hypothetical protein